MERQKFHTTVWRRSLLVLRVPPHLSHTRLPADPGNVNWTRYERNGLVDVESPIHVGPVRSVRASLRVRGGFWSAAVLAGKKVSTATDDLHPDADRVERSSPRCSSPDA